MTTNSESWQDVPIDALANHRLSQKIIAMLQAAGLDTLDKLHAHKCANFQYGFGQALAGRRSPFPLIDIPGGGRAMSKKIINALGAYRKAHPEPTP